LLLTITNLSNLTFALNLLIFLAEIKYCVIAHSITNQSWTGRQRLQCVTGGSTFKCWILTSIEKQVYVFGITTPDGTNKYVTYNSMGAPYTLQPCSKDPTDINIDLGEEKDDARAFYYHLTSTSGRLVSASSPGLNARLVANTGAVVADSEGDRWTLKLRNSL